MTKGPIVIVDDDADDQKIYADAIKAFGIPNEIRPFVGGQEVLDYLATTVEQPFIILFQQVPLNAVASSRPPKGHQEDTEGGMMDRE